MNQPLLEHGPDPSAGSGWTSTETALSIAGLLRRARRVVVLTHAKPDGDAFGSTSALVRTLRALSIDAAAWYVGPMPRWADALTADLPHRVLDARAIAAGALDHEPEPDCVVVCDTGAWAQVDELRAWLQPRAGKAVIIDHHLSGAPDMAPRRLLDPHAAAAAELVAEVCQRLLAAKDPSRLPLPIATPLFLGLGTDTGWFRFSNTRPATLRLAAALIEAGVDHAGLFEMIEQQDRPARLRLLGRAFGSIELLANDQAAVMALSARDFDECHGDSEDAAAFATIALSAAPVRVAAVLTEVQGRAPDQPLTKVSLRSKPGANAIDVAALTRSLGGGGHARAAGVKLSLPLPEARAQITRALLAALA